MKAYNVEYNYTKGDIMKILRFITETPWHNHKDDTKAMFGSYNFLGENLTDFWKKTVESHGLLLNEILIESFDWGNSFFVDQIHDASDKVNKLRRDYEYSLNKTADAILAIDREKKKKLRDKMKRQQERFILNYHPHNMEKYDPNTEYIKPQMEDLFSKIINAPADKLEELQPILESYLIPNIKPYHANLKFDWEHFANMHSILKKDDFEGDYDKRKFWGSYYSCLKRLAENFVRIHTDANPSTVKEDWVLVHVKDHPDGTEEHIPWITGPIEGWLHTYERLSQDISSAIGDDKHKKYIIKADKLK